MDRYSFSKHIYPLIWKKLFVSIYYTKAGKRFFIVERL